MSCFSSLIRTSPLRRDGGEPLDLVARETNVTVAKLTEWRDRALAGAASAVKERERDERDDEIARLKSKVGEITCKAASARAATSVSRRGRRRAWSRDRRSGRTFAPS
jgi:hypothetical protein